jgi:hypothetical protein
LEINMTRNLIITLTLCLLAACGGGTSDDNSDTGDARVNLPTVDCSTGSCK